MSNNHIIHFSSKPTSFTLAGENKHASVLLPPAATVTVTPDWMRFFTASSNEKEAPPPKDSEAMAGLVALAATQSKPESSERSI